MDINRRSIQFILANIENDVHIKDREQVQKLLLHSAQQLLHAILIIPLYSHRQLTRYCCYFYYSHIFNNNNCNNTATILRRPNPPPLAPSSTYSFHTFILSSSSSFFAAGAEDQLPNIPSKTDSMHQIELLLLLLLLTFGNSQALLYY